MKTVFSLIFFCLLFSAANAQSKTSVPDNNKKIQTVEASCGECQFKLPGKGCHLAVRIDGKAYFVDGTSIDEHGDAHANDGFCEAIRKAQVQGTIVNDRFQATYFKLLAVSKDKEPKKTTAGQNR
ncbi:MAG TPA: DUF6370 family protein [Chitinophagaceae bacterium]|nr:DUF6370 family protein [Chitinophagaceae bacterium]